MAKEIKPQEKEAQEAPEQPNLDFGEVYELEKEGIVVIPTSGSLGYNTVSPFLAKPLGYVNSSGNKFIIELPLEIDQKGLAALMKQKAECGAFRDYSKSEFVYVHPDYKEGKPFHDRIKRTGLDKHLTIYPSTEQALRDHYSVVGEA